MNMHHWALPISTLDGQLLGVELETRVEVNGCRLLMTHGMKESVFSHPLREAQTSWLKKKAAWFTDNNLFCVIKAEPGSLEYSAPFIKYFSSNSDEHASSEFWVDEMGARSSSPLSLFAEGCEVVRFNKAFTEQNIDRIIFPVLLDNVRRHCDKIIVPVYQRQYHTMLKKAGVWAVQGQCRPVHFSHCELLLSR
ncbi:Uncharacterised protein [Cedecea lapagei]|uniref:Uncharacterized protein n=1 Tax=Cedecea lapagei TaxID=158823 RepID=A0A447V077_9ENTR|nr:hypothetical protein [Cedecea lapagei]VEB96281.1 Uncharacterised protein [Cedecea lapagei]